MEEGSSSAPWSEGALSFADRNPNPVLRVAADGTLEYANAASRPVLKRLGVGTGDRVPDVFRTSLDRAARFEPPEPFELECELRTFAILAVPVPDGALNVYGSDITGVKVVEKFPDRNPNPVLRINPEGRLLYANQASGPIRGAMGVKVGELIPGHLHDRIRARLAGESHELIEVGGEGGLFFAITPVAIAEFSFVNLYGTDITGLRAINKFPDENPNPVLRVTRAGRLQYANPSSAPVRRALGVEVGDELPPTALNHVRAILDGRATNVMEAQHDGRVFELRVVSLSEFESINIYGTDVTATRELAHAHAENERLLLNILPASIAERLRRGEEPIADAFEDMAVLFADVVEFTPYSASRPAHEVVTVLNQMFSIFDRLVDKHRLEKIKTVGDAYMVVGGLTPDGGGPTAVAEMALDMIDEIGRYRTDAGQTMRIRVGLHVGPGIGGVIGLKKFVYDVWGDTVNTASRMESNGWPGCIQVTGATAARLEDGYTFERRGIVEVKGKGAVETFFLVGRR
ncbi:MAG TPA: adenylate/guanylate cyclase domain-containing protein [Candidatus Limnocylindria bacterium]|nr:adenylate/guanylate cyclase domain-containing protein [Candidatus Limnocylindria bacterium]